MNDHPDINQLLKHLGEAKPLSSEQAIQLFALLMDGKASDIQIAGSLMALAVRGETIDEISAGVSVLRAKMTKVKAPAGAIDIVGTGGDGSGTINVSTAAAIILAGAGLTVAKHGNKGLSSRSGAADVLSELGVNIKAPIERLEQAIAEAGIGFMMAPYHHSSMKNVAAARTGLGVRTVFNILGPLANPAGVTRQVTGVFSKSWLKPMALTLKKLGSEKAWLVHGAGGMDEISTLGTTDIVAWTGTKIEEFQIEPEDAGIKRAMIDDVKGGSPAENALTIHNILNGEQGPKTDITLLNAAAALWMTGKARDLKEGMEQARESIKDGKAKQALQMLRSITNAGEPS